MNKKALINIDYTNDFVSDKGALTCGIPAQQIEENILAVTKQFIANGDYVVFAVDIHHKGDRCHPETDLFPAHNLSGSNGRNLYGELNRLYDDNCLLQNVYWMDKTRYSAFAGTDLELKLREREISELHLVGVCTDICVLHTAIDAYNKGFKIVVYKDAVASFNQVGHEWSLGHFKACLGADVI
ncbi:cysteine hydrolase family protein [Guptibacillus hwajinpoensis]|uniref:cysteine hydrolase family protein n=1 Tax=Guptibacillus hwajinpoensis TaxID=208199 RepID=UPI001CFD77F8|nr:isochorismatase family cysteine hydrolase [Pseudalkalibacillus hwajinpoensis]WLR61544.1 isochorismatase family cysteine hydrolase [Pseudalkalibacillus hwajinpoensis]